MRRFFAVVGVMVLLGVILEASAASGTPAVTVSADARVTGQRYVRHDGGTDPTIQVCNSEARNDFGNNVQNNEPFSVVDPSNPNLVVSGWNDYCSDWMGLGFSTDGGASWTDSLVPGYPADTSTEGTASPEYIRTNEASDPVAGFDLHEHFYFGFISYNGAAGPKTNSDVSVARYDVVDPATNGGYPLDYVGTTRVGQGPAAANFRGRFNDKDMLEVDRTGGRFDGNVYMCWSKFPGVGNSTTIYFSRSTDGGATFSNPIAVSQKFSGQGCDIAIEHDGDVYVSWRDFDGQSANAGFGVSAARSGDGGVTFGKPVKIAALTAYNPFDGARDCGDGIDACPSGYVFSRVPLEPRLVADQSGGLSGVYSIFQATDPSTIVAAQTSYSSAGAGLVGQSAVMFSRSTNDGATWSAPARVAPASVGHQFFPDADALNGTLAVMWQDSRTDPAYSIQRPLGNTASATSSGTNVVNTFVATSSNGRTFGAPVKASSVGNQPQYEMFDAASVPFYGDYDWIQLVQRGSGLFGYLTWTDNRDVVTGNDPREATQDGFDTKGCWVKQSDGTYVRTCINAGGYDQNIYGASVSI